MPGTRGSLEGPLRGLNLRQRLLLLLTLAAAPGVAVAVFLAWTGLEQQRDQIETAAARLAALHAAQHSTAIGSTRALLETIAESQPVQRLAAADCERFLSRLITERPMIASLEVIGADGETLCDSGGTDLAEQATPMRWLDRLKDGEDFTVSDWTLGSEGAPVLVAAVALQGAGDGFPGALAAIIGIEWLDFLAQATELPAGGTVTAFNLDGEIIAHSMARSSPRDSEDDERLALVPSDETRRDMLGQEAGLVRGVTLDGHSRSYGFHRTDDGELVLAVGMQPYLGFEQLRRALFDTLLAPLLVLLLALAATAYASEAFITRWVRSIQRTARELGRGNLEARTEVPHDEHEIGELAASIDHMAEEIQEREERLEESAHQRGVLFKELSHRVKNNLQMILSLIRIEAGKSPSQPVKSSFRSLESHVHVIASVYDLLHVAETEKTARPSPNYLTNLGRSLRELYSNDQVEVEVEVEALPISIDRAISVGIIANELLANARKHAFGGRVQGHIWLTIAKHHDGHKMEMIVRDDGVGVPDIEALENKANGLRLARGLATQLGGEIRIEPKERGVAFHVILPIEQREEQDEPAEALQASQ